MKSEKCHNKRDAFRFMKIMGTTKSSYSIKYADYQKVADEFFHFLGRELIRHGELNFPMQMGKLYISKHKPTSKPINFKNIKLNKKNGNRDLPIYYFNEKTNGYMYKIKWSSMNVHTRNKALYRFVAGAYLKKYVTDALKKGLDLDFVKEESDFCIKNKKDE